MFINTYSILRALSFSLAVLAIPQGFHGWKDHQNSAISTTSGRIHGMIDEAYPNVRQYLGIPFAQAPVGSLRWQPPKSLPQSAANRDVYAIAEPPSCPQTLNPISPSVYNRDVLQFNLQGLNATGATSEDCLSVSVWAPEGACNDKNVRALPVLMFIYGGGFSTGGIDVPYQIPTQWVERTKDHIVVSFNYRVNLFGFPGAAGLTEQNVGLLDQRAAVEWVEANIASFGGDPSRITLWGQSAGAVSVDYYAFTYWQDPLVAGLIMDSGSSGTTTPKVETDHSNFTFVASKVGCGGLEGQPADQLSCMQGVDFHVLEGFLYNYSISGQTPGLSFGPVADDKVVFTNYTERALNHLQAQIPAILGTNAQDGVAFAPYDASGVNQTLAQYALLATFLCPETQTILDRQATGLTTFRYLYSGNWSNIAPRSWEGAFHSSELPLLMGTFDNYRGAGPLAENLTSVAMQDAYLAFAKGGAVGLESTGWMEYTKIGESTVREFGADGVPVQDTNVAALEALCSGGKPNYSL